ncbi:hypothetical protein MNV49_007521 [Pseudohyphozyma bogoriensis]|nr:hypothetical protein MNV49_007521 [Pseudohyphozyma bogoriensis]
MKSPSSASKDDYRPFNTIPNELLRRIVTSSLPRATLLSLSRVSKLFNDVATIAVYETLDITVWEYAAAHRLMAEFAARPQLCHLVRTVGVRFTNPDDLLDTLVGRCDRHEVLDASEDLKKSWDANLDGLKTEWEDGWLGGEKVLSEKMWMEEKVEGFWKVFKWRPHARSVVLEQAKRKEQGAWLDEEGHVRGLEAFVRFFKGMKNVKGLRIDQGGPLTFGAEEEAFGDVVRRVSSVSLNASEDGIAPLLRLLSGGVVQQLHFLNLEETVPLNLQLPSLHRLLIQDPSFYHPSLNVVNFRRAAALLRSAPALECLEISPHALYHLCEFEDISIPRLRHLVLEDLDVPTLPEDAWSRSSPFSKLVSSSSCTTLEFSVSVASTATRVINHLPPNITSLSIHVRYTLVDEIGQHVVQRMKSGLLGNEVKVWICWRSFGVEFEPRMVEIEGRVMFERDEEPYTRRWWKF